MNFLACENLPVGHWVIVVRNSQKPSNISSSFVNKAHIADRFS